jgi:hypothetical protein
MSPVEYTIWLQQRGVDEEVAVDASRLYAQQLEQLVDS